MAHWSSRLQQSSGYAGYFSQPTTPTTSQIEDGKWGWWFDTINLRLVNIRNDSGVFRVVESAI